MADTQTVAAKQSGRRRSSTFILLGTFLFSAILLFISLRDIDTQALIDDVKELNWWWIAAAVASDIAVYIWQGVRWRLLLVPITPVSLQQCVRAIYVGLYANEVLPLRTGEVIRCYLLARWTQLPFTVTLSSALIERIFDGVWLIALLLLTAVAVPHLPRGLVDAGYGLGLLVLVGAALLAVAMFFREPVEKRFGHTRLYQKIHILFDDLDAIGHSRNLMLAALASLPYLLLQILPIYCTIQAYGLELSLGDAAAVMVVLRLGSVVPQAPGNLGLFQILAIQALRMFAVERAVAQRFALVLWGVITLPLLAAGFIALLVTGMRIRELQHEARRSREQSREPVNGPTSSHSS